MEPESADSSWELFDAAHRIEIGQPDSDELLASLSQLDQSMAEIVAGRTLSVAAAREFSLSKLSDEMD
jgi:hypothetical protein